MAVFDIGATVINPGAERHTIGVDPPARVTALSVALVDTSALWDVTVGNVLRWGVQASKSDGTFFDTLADWQNEGSTFQDNLPFGSRARNGGMPSIKIAKTDVNGNPLPVAGVGVKLRLAIRVDTAITLGARIGTNVDA